MPWASQLQAIAAVPQMEEGRWFATSQQGRLADFTPVTLQTCDFRMRSISAAGEHRFRSPHEIRLSCPSIDCKSV
jgi:hypothetical protein